MSRTESDVDSVGNEMGQNADVCDMKESIGFECTNDTGTQEQDEKCTKCDVLANRIVNLQKKISWLKKSKQKLNDSLNVVYNKTDFLLESR